jgi:hypothetical protein
MSWDDTRKVISFPRWKAWINVRLQARAACGASLCKPWFGGIRARTILRGDAAIGDARQVRLRVDLDAE